MRFRKYQKAPPEVREYIREICEETGQSYGLTLQRYEGIGMVFPIDRR